MERLEIERNVYLYWVGKSYKLISILRNLIYYHSKNGKGYNVILITKNNINDYVKNIPENFENLCPAHQADIVRVNVLCDYGGIWLDSDTIVMDSLDELFDIVENKDGFFIRENSESLCNGVFGSKKQTPLMLKWKNYLTNIFQKKIKIEWTTIGSKFLNNVNKSSEKNLFDNYVIFDGLENMYPVNWDKCVEEFINKPYNNHINIIRKFQPLIVLVNSVYKNLENKSEKMLFNSNCPLTYFINKSFENAKLIDYDFIEIGTSNFDTLIEKADDNTLGISVEAVKHYIDDLPCKSNVRKLNAAISDVSGKLYVYYIPEDAIKENNLNEWFKGCNSINNFHPLHIKHNVTHLCKKDEVNVMTIFELFYQNKVRNVKFLKIDTEGHDCVILNSLHSYIKYLPRIFYPKKILFESNENITSKDVDKTITLFCSLGYKLKHRGHDTILVHD